MAETLINFPFYCSPCKLIGWIIDQVFSGWLAEALTNKKWFHRIIHINRLVSTLSATQLTLAAGHRTSDMLYIGFLNVPNGWCFLRYMLPPLAPLQSSHPLLLLHRLQWPPSRLPNPQGQMQITILPSLHLWIKIPVKQTCQHIWGKWRYQMMKWRTTSPGSLEWSDFEQCLLKGRLSLASV